MHLLFSTWPQSQSARFFLADSTIIVGYVGIFFPLETQLPLKKNPIQGGGSLQ